MGLTNSRKEDERFLNCKIRLMLEEEDAKVQSFYRGRGEDL